MLLVPETVLALALLDDEPYGLRRAWLRAGRLDTLRVLSETWGSPY